MVSCSKDFLYPLRSLRPLFPFQAKRAQSWNDHISLGFPKNGKVHPPLPPSLSGAAGGAGTEMHRAGDACPHPTLLLGSPIDHFFPEPQVSLQKIPNTRLLVHKCWPFCNVGFLCDYHPWSEIHARRPLTPQESREPARSLCIGNGHVWSTDPWVPPRISPVLTFPTDASLDS